MRIALLLSALFCSPAHACYTASEFGSFSGDPAGTFVSRDYVDRPLFQLTSPFKYTSPNGDEFTVVEEYIIDGASIPRILWSTIGGPFSEFHLKASIVHDYYTDTCQTTGHSEPGRVCQNNLTTFEESDLVHENYYLGMRAAGVTYLKACAEFIAVSAYKDWDLDENQQPTNVRVLFRQLETINTNVSEADIGIMRGSIASAIKLLRATNGENLALFSDGFIPATPGEFQEYIDRLGSAISSGEYVENPDILGLVTNEVFTDIEELEPWSSQFLEDRLVPSSGQYQNLTFLEPFDSGVADPLTSALGLEPQIREQVQIFGVDNLDLDRLTNETAKQDLIDLLTDMETGPVIVDESDLRIYENSEQSGVTFEFNPDVLERFQQNGVSLPFGSTGSIILQETSPGEQLLLIEPSPLIEMR
jgi:hypothetical protein